MHCFVHNWFITVLAVKIMLAAHSAASMWPADGSRPYMRVPPPPPPPMLPMPRQINGEKVWVGRARVRVRDPSDSVRCPSPPAVRASANPSNSPPPSLSLYLSLLCLREPWISAGLNKMGIAIEGRRLAC